jgi:hypothetical protein
MLFQTFRYTQGADMKRFLSLLLITALSGCQNDSKIRFCEDKSRGWNDFSDILLDMENDRIKFGDLTAKFKKCNGSKSFCSSNILLTFDPFSSYIPNYKHKITKGNLSDALYVTTYPNDSIYLGKNLEIISKYRNKSGILSIVIINRNENLSVIENIRILNSC